jgi:ABC-type lipoprotein release transport system permease subunit
MAYAVAQRTREIGARLALSAPRSDIPRPLLRQGLPAVVARTLVGTACAAAASRLIAARFYGVSPLDPLAFTGAAVFLGLVALAAAAVPARRATRVDPLVVLTHE